MKTCPRCGKQYENVEDCPHIVILDDNPVSISSYFEEFPETAATLEQD